MKDIEIWLDMDGVLADFDAGAQAQLGTDNTYKYEFVHGAKAFWTGLDANPNFFLTLPRMKDMHVLWGALADKRVGVLTALPFTGAERVERHKVQWIQENLGHQVPVVCCVTKDKPKYCTPGAVLIDDRAVNRDMWTANGGRFIVHTSAISTIYQLQNLGVI